MAAKFSMANPAGLFGAEAHAEASDRLQDAARELQARRARQDAQQQVVEQQREAQEQEQARRLARAVEAQAAARKAGDDRGFVAAASADAPEEDADSSDDELLDAPDPELERLRAQRLAQLKQEAEQERALRAKGHGEYREIAQDAFLPEVTASPLALVHFYHRDFERCKIMDMHLARLAPKHVECKFLKLDAEKAPFFVDRLAVRVLPTVVCFRAGVAFPERLVGFDGLSDASDEQRELDAFGSRAAHRRAADSDAFPTAALARRLAAIGAIHEQDDSDGE